MEVKSEIKMESTDPLSSTTSTGSVLMNDQSQEQKCSVFPEHRIMTYAELGFVQTATGGTITTTHNNSSGAGTALANHVNASSANQPSIQYAATTPGSNSVVVSGQQVVPGSRGGVMVVGAGGCRKSVILENVQVSGQQVVPGSRGG